LPTLDNCQATWGATVWCEAELKYLAPLALLWQVQDKTKTQIK